MNVSDDPNNRPVGLPIHGEKDGLGTDDIIAIYGMLQHGAWPLVLRIMRGMVAADREALEDEGCAADRGNVLRGRIQAINELVGTLGLTITREYLRTLPKENAT